jgi:hypothetical protein
MKTKKIKVGEKVNYCYLKTKQFTVIVLKNEDLLLGKSDGLFYVKQGRYISAYSQEEMVEIYGNFNFNEILEYNA